MKTFLLIAALTLGTPMLAAAQSADEAAVLRVEEELRVAEVANDIDTLDRISHPNYYAVNQNGNARDKAQFLELWKTFKVQSIVKENLRVKITDDTAVVTGDMIEHNAGIDRMLFTRVYRRERNRWLLLASMQARRSSPTAEPMRAQLTTRGGLTAEEVRVGGSCVVVISRPGAGDLAVTPCSTR